MLFFVLCSLFLPYVLGGTPCPPREDIYPCICLDRSIGKSKFDTTVICRGLLNADSLLAIEPNLSEMEIDKFLLYDSFWQARDPRMLQLDMRIPVNHVTTFKMDEVEVVDTILTNFGCPSTDNCRTSYLKKFTALNSSVSDRASCGDNSGVTITSWITCPQNVKQLTINKGFTSDVSLKPEFFPEPMTNLESLYLPHNRIARIDKRTFTSAKFPILHTLDLSHNNLRDVKSAFSSPLKLQHLDLSHNSIRTLIDLQMLSSLRTLKINDNQIINLLEPDWQNLPSSLKHIDLTNNSIICNCGTQWINSTFPVHTALLGTCGSPPEVASMKIRRASRFLIERCDQDGRIGPKKPKSKQH